MPKTYCISNTLIVDKNSAIACSQTSATIGSEQIRVANEVIQGEEIQWRASNDSSIVIAKLKKSGYQLPIQAWSFAQLTLHCGSAYSALLQFAYNRDIPDEIIVVPVKVPSFSDISIINNTYLSDNDLVPGYQYVVQGLDTESTINQAPLEYVGKFESDTENRVIFIRGMSLYQVKPGMNYIKKNDNDAASLTGPRRKQLLEVMRAWADHTWYEDEKDMYQDQDWRTRPIREVFASDMEVSRLATKLCTLRKISVAAAVSMYRSYPLNIRFDRAKQLEVYLDIGRNARQYSEILKNFPLQRSIPAMSDLGRDVSAWREFFIDIYEKSTPAELDIYWLSHPAHLVNDCYQSITNIR